LARDRSWKRLLCALLVLTRQRIIYSFLLIHSWLINQSLPLVEGISFERASIIVAWSSARPTALKAASIIWCKLSPCFNSIWRLHLRVLVRDLKNSLPSSASNSPILLFGVSTRYAQKGRPLRSTDAKTSASSKGTNASPNLEIPLLSPSAVRNASPKARPTSSTV